MLLIDPHNGMAHRRRLDHPKKTILLEDAAALIPDGASVMIGGFMGVVGPQPVGAWVLAFHAAARRVMSQEEAAQTTAALDALAAALAGETDLGRLFPDLSDREPQLPAHLRSPMK